MRAHKLSKYYGKGGEIKAVDELDLEVLREKLLVCSVTSRPHAILGLPELLSPRHGDDFSEFHAFLLIEEVI